MPQSASGKARRILSPANRGLSFLPDAYVSVHSGTVIFIEGLGHECNGLTVTLGNVLQDIFEPHQLVAHLDQRRELHVDLGSGRL